MNTKPTTLNELLPSDFFSPEYIEKKTLNYYVPNYVPFQKVIFYGTI